MVVQGRWASDSSLLQVPFVEDDVVAYLNRSKPMITCLPELMQLAKDTESLTRLLQRSSINKFVFEMFDCGNLKSFDVCRSDVTAAVDAIRRFPVIQIGTRIKSKDGTVVSALEAGEEYFVDVELRRLNSFSGPHAHAPAFSKQIDESWFLILGQAC